MSPPVKLRMESVTKRFEAADARVTVAVQDFTLDVRQGEFLVIVGPSGCGKTTVLKLLSRLVRRPLPTTNCLPRSRPSLTARPTLRSAIFQGHRQTL